MKKKVNTPFLLDLMKKKKLDDNIIAEAYGINCYEISAFLNNRNSSIMLRDVFKIARALKLEIGDLFIEEDFEL